MKRKGRLGAGVLTFELLLYYLAKVRGVRDVLDVPGSGSILKILLLN